MKTPILVSVVMTVWNRASIIGPSVESILAQTYTHWELIVVDDGSTDDTCAVVEAYKDERIHLLRRPHLGIVASANFGISQAHGEWIARLDSDDLCAPERFERQVAAVKNNPRAVLCYTDCELFGRKIPPKQARFVRNSMLIAIRMGIVCPLTHSSVMFQKKAFDRAGGYLPETPVAEDYSLFARLILEGTFVGVPEKLVKYLIHDASATQENLALMKRLTVEIATQHLQSYFKFSKLEASSHHLNLTKTPGARDLRLWATFCRRVLSFRQSWRMEPLAWIFVQSAKILLAKIRDTFQALPAETK